MEKVLRRLFALKGESESFNSELGRKYGVATDMMPIAGLNMAHNQIVRAVELVSYYRSVLPRPQRGSVEDFMNDEPESAQRIVDLLNSCFVAVLSSFESCARKAIRWAPNVYGKAPRKIYLVNIMERSRKLGWIEQSEEIMWKNFIRLRNYIVHNNGEAQENAYFTLPSGLIWEFRIGLQSKVTLRHVSESLDWLIRAYTKWCDQFLIRWCDSFDYAPAWFGFFSYNITSRQVIPHWGVDGWAGNGPWTWQEQPPPLDNA